MVPDPPRSDGGRAAADVPAPDAASARRILALLQDDDVDAAITAGLAHFMPLAGLDDAANGALLAARDRLLAAWAARDRHRARALRLERIAEERRQARQASPRPTGNDDGAAAGAQAAPPRPSLPAAAAAALARARARATGRGS